MLLLLNVLLFHFLCLLLVSLFDLLVSSFVGALLRHPLVILLLLLLESLMFLILP